MPRAGSNHPATLEMFDEIGLYERLEARGLIAPRFQYRNRADNRLIAEFDHAVITGDTRFPYVLRQSPLVTKHPMTTRSAGKNS